MYLKLQKMSCHEGWGSPAGSEEGSVWLEVVWLCLNAAKT